MNNYGPMGPPTLKEVLELVSFQRDSKHNLVVQNVLSHVRGKVLGKVNGTIDGREWQYIETPKDKAIRLIREGKNEEALKVLEEDIL